MLTKKSHGQFNMRLSTFFFLVLLVFASPTFAYPQDQFKDCVTSANQNPSVKSASQDAIRNYCDCALTLIVDEKEDVRKSGYECAVKSFG